ncbi:hypothetical protein [Ferrovibrio sp.]|uniref:hypothetical protein n=1 Tax=Ferrovibrio sp. TaxID=1917215 RepID=UPI0035B131BD
MSETIDTGSAGAGTEQTAQTSTDQSGSESTVPAMSPRLTTPSEGGSLFGDIKDESEDSAVSETDEIDIAKEDLILGKFKSQDDLIKSYQALETKLKSRDPIVDVPESYDFQTAFSEAGLEAMDPESEEGKVEYAEFDEFLRGNKFSQKQMSEITKFGKNWMHKQMLRYGPQVDVEAEVTALRGEWGESTQKNAEAVVKWARANLSPAVMNKPLTFTKEGILFLDKLMKQQRGPVPIQNNASSKTSKDDLVLEMQKLMDDPHYGTSTDAGKALQNKAYKLAEALNRFQ